MQPQEIKLYETNFFKRAVPGKYFYCLSFIVWLAFDSIYCHFLYPTILLISQQSTNSQKYLKKQVFLNYQQGYKIQYAKKE